MEFYLLDMLEFPKESRKYWVPRNPRTPLTKDLEFLYIT
jgi:hypothetical protein